MTGNCMYPDQTPSGCWKQRGNPMERNCQNLPLLSPQSCEIGLHSLLVQPFVRHALVVVLSVFSQSKRKGEARGAIVVRAVLLQG
jgi:hypothetical protein